MTKASNVNLHTIEFYDKFFKITLYCLSLWSYFFFFFKACCFNDYAFRLCLLHCYLRVLIVPALCLSDKYFLVFFQPMEL